LNFQKNEKNVFSNYGCRLISPNRISPNLISPNRSSSWVYCRAPTKIELRLGLGLGLG